LGASAGRLRFLMSSRFANVCRHSNTCTTSAPSAHPTIHAASQSRKRAVSRRVGTGKGTCSALPDASRCFKMLPDACRCFHKRAPSQAVCHTRLWYGGVERYARTRARRQMREDEGKEADACQRGAGTVEKVMSSGASCSVSGGYWSRDKSLPSCGSCPSRLASSAPEDAGRRKSALPQHPNTPTRQHSVHFSSPVLLDLDFHSLVSSGRSRPRQMLTTGCG
jgi:hypothetical protein